MSVTQEEVLGYIAQHHDQPELLRPIRLAADKAIKAGKGGMVVHRYNYTSESLGLANWLYEAIKARYDFVKEPNLEQWAHDIECIMRIDGYARLVVQGVLQYSQQDEFWRQQVRSGANLRKHFEKIYIKAREQAQKQQRGGVYKV